MSTAADRLHALAKGPALDLPPVYWDAPEDVSDGTYPFARWGALAWEAGPTVAPGHRVYLCAYDIAGIEGPSLAVGKEHYTVAEAKALLNRLASALAVAEELSR